MMHNANIFLAHQRVLDARQQACEAREARISRRGRKPRSLRDRLRGEH
jgi:hypothetical protein